MIEVLSTFGQLACGENESVRVQVAKTVASFYTEQTNQALIEGTSWLMPIMTLFIFFTVHVGR